MNEIQEVKGQYKQAVRQYLRHADTESTDVHRTVSFYEGRMLGLDVALGCLGVNSDEIREIYKTCEEGVRNEKEQEARKEKC